MCTLIVLDRIASGYPLVVASNRDEFYSRPAAPPARVDSEEDLGPPFVAPQDLEAGGTWMGVNAAGLFVGLTNRPVEGARQPLRSRGLLVRDALAKLEAGEVAQEMRDGLVGRYNPFHLLAADGRSAHLTVLRGGSAESRALDPGIHVICNRDPDDPGSGKVRALEKAVAEIDLGSGFGPIFAGLAAVLGSHPDRQNPLENACVHTPEYGTRSSTILALGLKRWRYWHAEGAPCEAKYSNLSRLLDEIR
jgi:uncharacterized protein with NRDE domain